MSSKKPSKTRSDYYNMPMHKRSKAIMGHLNEKLKKEIGARSVPIRKNDTVKIMRGEYKGKTGKITNVDRLSMKINVEKIVRKKSDGAEYEVAIDPSNVLLIEVEKNDQKRFKNLKASNTKKEKK
jgi:large subunit ribosomal protein L24